MSDASVPRTVDRATWLEARRAHLTAEKEFTRERDRLSAARRELPWLEIDTDYVFTTDDGPVRLADLFGDCGQLLVYHFMMGPDWTEGCPSCSFWADNYEGTQVHLAHRDTALVAVSRTPIDQIQAYRQRMGWSFRWVSSLDNDFNFDMAVSFTPDQIAAGDPLYNFGTQAAFGPESPGISAFARDGDRVFLTYQTFARGLDMLNGAYHLLDLTSKGRDEGELEWPMAWLARHESYEA